MWITSLVAGLKIANIIAYHRVVTAIVNSRMHLADYFRRTLVQRLDSPEKAGVLLPWCWERGYFIWYFRFSSVEIHGRIQQPSSSLDGGICCHVPGVAGVVDLSSLRDDKVIILNNQKNTGYFSVTIALQNESMAAKIIL